MKRLLSLAAMFLCCIATTFAQFSGSGSGTENDPYLITNPIHLNQLRNYLNQNGVYFKLMANIDLTEYLEDENPSQGWQPVGNSSSAAFKGILDGNGFTISGLWTNRSSSNYVGLFGYTQDATIKNLTVTATSIQGKNDVAIITGYSASTTISNCSASGSIQGVSLIGGYVGDCGNNMVLSDNYANISIDATGDYIGGFVGRNDASNNFSISGCKLDGTIRGANYVGGCCGAIVGNHGTSNSISSSYIHSNIEGSNYVGGICGYSSNYSHTVNLSGCGYVGNITGTEFIGGLVGYIKKTSSYSNDYVQKSFAIGKIVATGNDVGGLIGYDEGYNYYKNILSECYFSGSVSGNNNVGGLVGYKKYGEISKSYSFCSVAGTQKVGGIVGHLDNSSTTLKTSVAICTRITATEGSVGRIAGLNNGTIAEVGSTDENKAYNRTIVISQGVAQDINDDLQNGTGVSKTTLKLRATYVAMGWDFTNTWAIQETECYPYFKMQTAPPVIQSQVVSGATTVSGKCIDGGTITLEIDGTKQQMVSTGNTFSFTVSPLQAGHEVRVSAKADDKEQSYYTTEVVSYLGKGTEADPYQVYTASDLTGVYRKGYFKLMNDIDLTDYINQFSPTEGWESIGREGSETIHFDGNGHKITGLWCNSTRNNTGLFSCFANGTIKNLTVVTAEGKQVKGGANTGILIGKMINGTIENCCVSGTVADGTPVGGMVGLFDGGAISLSQASVVINTTKGTSYVGGLVGEITNGTIDQCFTTGTLTATGSESYIGGLIGKNSGTVTNCYSNAKVSSSYNAAGLVAYNYGLVDKCYAMGDLFSNNYAAGVIGYNDGANAVVSNCAAMNNKIDVVYESQQVQQGGGYGQRIIGGIKNNAPAPAMNNYALKTMQVSVNDVPQIVYDDIMNGTAKTEEELTQQSTYASLGWNFSETWAITENSIYPYLQWITDISSNIPVTNVSLNPSSLSLAVGENRTINAVITPQDATNKSLQWTSSNVAVATVENGVVTAITSGSATITATTKDGSNISATCPITVREAGEEASEIEVTDISVIDNVIYIEPMEERIGTETVISFKMKNTVAIRGFQFDLYLPEGVTVVKSSKGRIQGALSEGRLPEEDEHDLTFSEQPDGAIRFLCSSQYDETFTGNDGEIATLQVNLAEGMEDGEYAIQLKDILLTETDISHYYATELVQSKLTIVSYVTGDISGDGVVNVSDYTGVANFIHGNSPVGFNAKAADVDENGLINVSDYTGIANIIHTGSVYGNRAMMKVGETDIPDTDISGIDNVIYIEPFSVAAGTQTALSIKMKNTAAIRGFQFDLYLPEGMTAMKSNKGRILGALSENRLPEEDEHDLTFSEQPNGAIRFLCSSQYDETFTGNDGEIATLQIETATGMEDGGYAILLKDVLLTETDISKFYETEMVKTTVTIGSSVEADVVLDETNTEIPEATAGDVTIQVIRTIKADEWSTICLPFDMTEAQTKAAFGNDVQLKEFTDYEVEYDANNNVIGLTVNFDVTDLTEGFYGNYPYLIKVSNDINGFTVTSTLNPVEDDCYTEYDNGRTGKSRKVYGTFRGTYHAQTVVPANSLFLSGNNFWYSTGQTKMKAFRAYFDFVDVLAEIGNANARISMSFDDETTSISEKGIVNSEKYASAQYYDLQGRRVEHPKKGLYIKNNKKVVVK